MLVALRESWSGADTQMKVLLRARVHGFSMRMWLHLGTALLLLGLLLTAVFFVARQISKRRCSVPLHVMNCRDISSRDRCRRRK